MLDLSHRIKLYKQLNPNELTTEEFLKLEEEVKHCKKNTISDEYFDFLLWSKGFPSRQENFANFICKKLSDKKGGKILEVGCGRTARLSRFLSKKGYNMSCIDPKVEVSKYEGIECIKGDFDYRQFDLSKYNYVIAQEPCNATEHVVRACTTQNIPFIMTLCGVPHELISGETPKDVYEWYNYLINIDSNKIKLRYINIDPFLSTPILRSNKF